MQKGVFFREDKMRKAIIKFEKKGINEIMSVQVEKLEKSMAKLTIEVAAADFEKAINVAYNKQKNKISIQGFRKGKAPRKIIEKMYGAGVFFEDAANELIPGEYEKAAKESGLEIVSQPQIDVVQIEKDKDFIFTATVAVKPEVTLGQFKGVEVEKVDAEVTQEDIDIEIEKLREENARTSSVERPIENNDIVTIDFDGYMDGEQFEGGYAENYDLVIGSHSFIDTFEDQLIGKNLNDEVEVNVNFPEDYHAAELAGKPAMFKVKINKIQSRELPEFNDDLVQDVSDFETVAEYTEDLKKELTEKKAELAKTEKEEKAIAKVIENATMEIPDAMIDEQVRVMANDFAQRIKQQGLSLEQYLQFTGSNANAFMAQLRPNALKRIQSRLVLEAIVAAENITATEDEITAEYQKMAEAYGLELDKIKEMVDESTAEMIKTDIAVQKAADLIVAEAVEA